MSLTLLKAAFHKATKGFWETKGIYSGGLIADWYGVAIKGSKFIDCGVDYNTIQGSERGKHDAEFISLAYNMMPMLLNAIELLKAAKETMLRGCSTSSHWYMEADKLLEGFEAGSLAARMVVLYTREDGQVFGIEKHDGYFVSVVPSDLAFDGEGHEHSTMEDTEAYLWDLIYKEVDVKDRFEQAIHLAEEAFWASFAESFPEIKTGDLGPDVVMPLQANMESAAAAWLNINCNPEHASSVIPEEHRYPE